MPQTRECDYCGADIEPGSGTMFVSVDGSVTHFCSGKCEKNANLGREPRDLEWTETARAEGQPAETEPEAEEESEADAEATTPDLEAAESESAESDESEEADDEEEAEA